MADQNLVKFLLTKNSITKAFLQILSQRESFSFLRFRLFSRKLKFQIHLVPRAFALSICGKPPLRISNFWKRKRSKPWRGVKFKHPLLGRQNLIDFKSKHQYFFPRKSSDHLIYESKSLIFHFFHAKLPPHGLILSQIERLLLYLLIKKPNLKVKTV